jgi:hypothetical protein
MADYTEYQSSNSAYNFSKGPKSLYYGKGDDELLGVVLNVPQTDVDDEWGGTERIAWERVVDQVSQLMVEVEDPYNSGTSGLINRVNVLLGVPGGSSGYFDTSVPSLTLGTVIVNGALNKINIGTTTEISSNSLSFGTSAFTISGSTNSYSIKFRKNELIFTDDTGGVNPVATDLYIDGVKRLSITRPYAGSNSFDITSLNFYSRSGCPCR